MSLPIEYETNGFSVKIWESKSDFHANPITKWYVKDLTTGNLVSSGHTPHASPDKVLAHICKYFICNIFRIKNGDYMVDV